MPLTSLATRDWRLASTPRIGLDVALDDPARLADWLPARVPGSIQRDLMRAGWLPDLYQELELDATLAWVDDADWWYRVELPAIAEHEQAWLRFDGIDYQAAVTLNGRELGRGPGMFGPRCWEISELAGAGQAEVGVRVWGGSALPTWPPSRRLRLRRAVGNRLQGGIPAFSDRLLSLKAPVHSGWDFSPRLLAAGIWDDVWLHTARGASMLDVWPRADWGADMGLIVRVEIDAAHAQSARLHATLNPANFAGAAQQHSWQITLQPGRQSLSLAWPDARLLAWHTHDRGHPHLYRLHLVLADEAGTMDERTSRVGARTIGWDGYAGATPLHLNGERLRLRGANWVPLDLLAGDPNAPDRYRHLLQSAVAAGVNALRVWGGGGREQKVFYGLCDELGLLVWQEMPIACVFLDHLPDDANFLALARRETRGIVRALRGHPSLMLWVGGNEWGPARNQRVAAALGETISQHDPSRRWLPASPGPGDSHNWRVWHSMASPQSYADDRVPLLSEFGLAAPPSASTLAAILPADQLWPPGDAWTKRKAELAKLRFYAGRDTDGEPGELDAFIAASQEAQARGLQVGMEAYRLRDDGVGTFIWQWNEPWPAICWSIFPYAGPPKPAYEQIKRSYAPLAAIARVLPAFIELWVVNDHLHSPGVCQLSASLGDEILWQGDVEPPSNGRVLVATIKRPDRSGGSVGSRLELRLRGRDFDLRNDYDLYRAASTIGRVTPLAWMKDAGKRWLLRW